MTERMTVAGLQVARELLDLLAEILPGTGIDAEHFWSQLADIAQEFGPRNAALLERREQLQKQIDQWHREHRGQDFDGDAYAAFLRRIDYLTDPVPPSEVSTPDVDPEIARLAGPQLVVPLSNARYALNAANARWGSLYDAVYGSDIIEDAGALARRGSYNSQRGDRVVAWCNDFLDRHFPLSGLTHGEARGYRVRQYELRALDGEGGELPLEEPGQFRGYQGETEQPEAILLANRGLHVEIRLDRHHPVGSRSPSGVSDILLEAALTTIQDCEDSVAAVNAADKARVYHNWLGLMRGDLVAEISKDGRSFRRELAADRTYLSPVGEAFSLPGRSLMLIRNVGHLMRSDAILLADGSEIFEGIMDTLFTALIALHDLRDSEQRVPTIRNSLTGSLYIVKPKMHGPDEVRFTVDLFARVEQALGLDSATIKLGIMDEERRTSLNLDACIRAARQRVVFINTGFLDRTGDEIHTSMEAGPMLRKADMKSQPWIKAYEQENVAAGLRHGLRGRAQIGKGMWAMPDEMRRMMEEKIEQLRAGASTAWVPSPSAATLHALHYHEVDVRQQQEALCSLPRATLADSLRIPLLVDALTEEQVERELDNNVQGILGYVVRWIDQGIGCSKVPDIDNVGLMEDRATLRISSQHIANWLHHGVCSEQQVQRAMEKMAAVVDEQNAGDPAYRPMLPDWQRNLAFLTARDLIFKGREQPNGYTEPLLHARRRQSRS